MKAVILNSGSGRRMGERTSGKPKCMTEIAAGETIVSRQLRMLADAGITEVVMTTGYLGDMLEAYCRGLELPLRYVFVRNPLYDRTNYIYSLYCAGEEMEREELRENGMQRKEAQGEEPQEDEPQGEEPQEDEPQGEDLLLLHGDLVFEEEVLDAVLAKGTSCMTVSTTLPAEGKDFKALVLGGSVAEISVAPRRGAVAAQPLYRLRREDWRIWMGEIRRFCEQGQRDCYAEEAFNRVADQCRIRALDVRGALCAEVDTPEDLETVSRRLGEIRNRTVYMCFSTDVIHSGHIAIIRRAQRLGKLIIGVLSDEAVAGYKRFPLLPYEERRSLLENIAGVYRVVEQKSLSYADNLRALRPDIVVHGDDWREGFQRPVREGVLEVLAEYGGRLVEYPYAKEERYEELERRSREQLAMPDKRRGRLRRLLAMKGCVNAIEAHNGLTGLIAENTKVFREGKTYQFDAMWLSSLCDSTARGKPDIELVDISARLRTVDEILEVTTKPVIFDGDTGGLTEHFVYTVRTLERMGVSMVIIEDKTGLKKNSLFGTEVRQTQAPIAEFCGKITAGKRAQKTKDFMICARIESLILEQGMEDALGRAAAYVEAGADAIMIHSRKKEPDEIFAFVERFRREDRATPLVVVPTAFPGVTEEEFRARGVNVVIYANQLTRTGVPAMQKAARLILENHRARECDAICMPFQEIIRLIPEE